MIESVEFRNFKCFKSQSMRLGPLTLLTGLNGMGKSTVIQSLLLLRQVRRTTCCLSEGSFSTVLWSVWGWRGMYCTKEPRTTI